MPRNSTENDSFGLPDHDSIVAEQASQPKPDQHEMSPLEHNHQVSPPAYENDGVTAPPQLPANQSNDVENQAPAASPQVIMPKQPTTVRVFHGITAIILIVVLAVLIALHADHNAGPPTLNFWTLLLWTYVTHTFTYLLSWQLAFGRGTLQGRAIAGAYIAMAMAAAGAGFTYVSIVAAEEDKA